MATVYLGRLAGPGGFSRLVAIKRPHAHVARHPEFRAMLLDEGRIAASISHPNVVSTLDVVAEEAELFLVMDYVPGRTLAEALRSARKRGEIPPPAVASAILHGVLLGLSAVHDARDEEGAPLGIVHRDVSPQNVLVGKDGIARILDFGVAKAAGRLQITREGQIKGKISYMAPEQMQGNATQRTDLYAASIVLWEALTGGRLFGGADEVEIFTKALTSTVAPPSGLARGAPADTLDEGGWARLDDLVLRGLARSPAERFGSAREMASALEGAIPLAAPAEVSAWLERTGEPDEEAGGVSTEPTSPRLGAGAPAAGAGNDGATVTESFPDAAAPRLRVREGDELSGIDELADRGDRAGRAAKAESILAPPARRRRSWSILFAGIAAVAGVALALAARHPENPRPIAATATSPLPTPDPIPSQAVVSPSVVVAPSPPGERDAVGPIAPGVVAGGARPVRGHDAHESPAPKNRGEHPRRAPVDSNAIDRALDVRH
jgi:hypothetical protein